MTVCKNKHISDLQFWSLVAVKKGIEALATMIGLIEHTLLYHLNKFEVIVPLLTDFVGH